MCSFGPLRSCSVHLDCNKLIVPLPKGPSCSHTRNLAQESIPVLTKNFMYTWGKKKIPKQKTHRPLKLEVAL